MKTAAARKRAFALGVAVMGMLATGCNPLDWFGPNFSLNIVIPLGLSAFSSFVSNFAQADFQNLIAALTGQGTTGG